MQSSPRKKVKTSPAYAIPEDVFKITYSSEMENFTPGSIMQVKFYKFMCYDNEEAPFILNLKPGLTVIHGQNGSGKSTIVDALQFCFGVTANKTDRASKLGEFVSHGHLKGGASVVLCNKLSSEGGFKPYYEEVFGSYILIGREATRSGIMTYHFDSEYVSLVENDLLVIKKEAKHIEDRLQRSIQQYLNFIGSNTELSYREAWRRIVDDICNHYSIQITNPLLILKQNMAKTFINGSAREKYDFLQQVMKTEKIENEINKAAEELIDAENDLNEVEEILHNKTKEVQNKQLILRKVKEAGGQDILAKQVSNAKHRLNKAHLKENNLKIEDKKKKIDKFNELQNELIDKMTKDEEESKVRENKAQSIVRYCNQANYKVESLSAERKRMYFINYIIFRINEMYAHKRRYEDNIRDLERSLLMLDRDIRTKKTEMRKIQSQSSNTKELSERIDELEKEIDILEKTKRQKSTEIEEKLEKNKIQKVLSDNCVKELSQLQSEMNQLKNKERDITEIINRIPQDKIQEASRALNGKIKGKIIWPVCAYVRVKPEYKKYTALIETKMKFCLDSAVISDNNDRSLIRTICQERKIPEPNITSIPTRSNDEVKTNSLIDERYEIVSLLDTFDFSELDEYDKALLKIYFSDVMKFDQTLLCSDDLKAEDYLKNQAKLQGKGENVYYFPKPREIDGMTKKFKEVLTLGEKKLTCTFGDLQSQYCAIHQASTILNQRKCADLDEYIRKQRECKDELAKKLKQYNDKNMEKKEITNMLIRLEKEIDKSKEENRIIIRKLEDKKCEKNECEDQLKEAQEGGDSKISKLIAEISDKENDVTRFQEQLEEQKKKKENDLDLIGMEERRVEIDKEIEDLQEEIKKYGSEIKELQAKNAEYNKTLEEDEGKKKSLMIKITSLNSEIETLRRDNTPYELSKNYNVEGGEIRTLEEENNEYSILKKRLDQIQNTGLPSLSEAEEELDEVQMEEIELESKYHQNLDIKNDLLLQIEPRKQDLLSIRDSVSDACQIKMIEYMMKFRSGATVTIDWDNKRVLLEIQPRVDESEENSTKDINQLSGGEKTRTTLCFFLSLLDQIKTPFLVMDEIDVFMDDYSRNKSYELILEVAEKSKRQMILLTPKEIDQIQLKNCLINLERKSLI